MVHIYLGFVPPHTRPLFLLPAFAYWQDAERKGGGTRGRSFEPFQIPVQCSSNILAIFYMEVVALGETKKDVGGTYTEPFGDSPGLRHT
jgi:hypothetical protein